MNNIKKVVLNSYKNFLNENNLEDNNKNIDLYLSYMFYEIQDNIENECINLKVPKDLEGISAQEYIEGEIIKIIKENIRGDKKMNRKELINKIENLEKELITAKEKLNINIYETVMIIDIKITLEKYNEIKERIKEIIEKDEIEKIEELGIRKLAYKIKENSEGYYYSITWYGDSKKTIELEKYIRQEKNILKYITIRKSEEDL